jgi:nicotinamidase-related amidase
MTMKTNARASSTPFHALFQGRLVFAVGFVLGGVAMYAVLNTDTASHLGIGGRALAQERAAGPARAAYVVPTQRHSYFRLDRRGGYEKANGSLIRDERTYSFERTIDPAKTAIVVMDPWIDMETDHLNRHFGDVAERRVVPLVARAIERGHRVIVLTNDPAVVTYNTKIHPALAAFVADGRAVLLYHQNLDDDQFADYLHKSGVDSLLYVGFASNMCVIGRRMGMIPMVQQGFRTYFVPEASAAVERKETWTTQSVHHETTKIISQWIAEIVSYDDFMTAPTK